MQFHCHCTTSSTTGQTSCVCTETGDAVSTNLSSPTSASIAQAKYPSLVAINGPISIDPEQFMFRGTIFGQSINVLVDSGATTSFLSKRFVD